MQNEKGYEEIDAYCDICDCQAKDDKKTLENQGWHLGRNEQFCPGCNY